MFVSKLFGLDSTLLMQSNSSELIWFKRISILFIVLISISFVAFFYFGFLLSNSTFFSILFASLFCFIFFCILRFSIITIGVPLNEELVLKKMLFNIGNVFRVLIFTTFVFVICVPFISLIKHREFSGSTEEYRNALFGKYLESKEKSKNQLLFQLQNEITKCNEEISHFSKLINSERKQQNKLLLIFSQKKLINKLEIIENKYAERKVEIENDNSRTCNYYKISLSAKEFPFFRFALTIRTSYLTALCFILIFCSIIPLYIYALVNKKNLYAKKFKEKSINDIENNYKNSVAQCDSYLKTKFKFNDYRSLVYATALKAKKVVSPITQIKDTNLFTHFENQHKI